MSYNEVNSEPYDISFGVSQGTVLGPLLLIIYSNDIPNTIMHRSLLVYCFALNLYNIHLSNKLNVLHSCHSVRFDLAQICSFLSVVYWSQDIPSSRCSIQGAVGAALLYPRSRCRPQPRLYDRLVSQYVYTCVAGTNSPHR